MTPVGGMCDADVDRLLTAIDCNDLEGTMEGLEQLEEARRHETTRPLLHEET